MVQRVVVWVLALTFLYQCLTYLLWMYEVRVHGGSRPAPSRLPYLTAWLADWLALLFALVASALGVFGRPRADARPNGRPIVLLHGWCMTRGSMSLLAARLRRDGRSTFAVNYPSLLADMDRKAAHVAASLRAIAAETGADSLDVLAHSQGGVIVRAAAKDHACLPLLGNVVTLGSPHQGTALAALLGWRRLAAERPSSRYLTRLAEDDPVPTTVNFTSIYSHFDAVVFPSELSYYAGAFNVAIDYVGHHSLLVSERVYQLAKENLDVDRRTP
jgi:pimeloyl-ACP methyl ester carboxylesterase